MKIAITLLFYSIMSFASDFPDKSEYLKYWDKIEKSDSGIYGPNYLEIQNELIDLQNSYPEYAEYIIYGKTRGARNLSLLKIYNRNTNLKLPAIYIGGSIHGNEYLNIEDRLPRWFLSQTKLDTPIKNYLDNGGVIYIAPILNPDGYDARRRENNRGVDLNRDYTVKQARVEGFKEVETSSLITYLDADLGLHSRKLEIAMDYHCCIGALLYPWSFKGPTISPDDTVKHQKIGKIINNSFPKDPIKVGTTPNILGYSAKGTSKDFYYERFGAKAFTYEGRRGIEDRYFTEHTEFWEKIVQEVYSRSN